VAIEVLLACAQRLLLQGISQSIEQDPELVVVGATTSVVQITALLESESPDLLLLDWDLLDRTPVESIASISRYHPDVKIVVLSQVADEDLIHDVLDHGASGYLLKTIEPDDLPGALRQTARGLVYHAFGQPQHRGQGATNRSGLTRREATVLRGVARGLSNRQIADELLVTEQTVKFHLTNVYRKLGVPNRLSAARYAYQHGLVGALDSA
jgi:DNA-binding NarL/FixJ family response regulator